jgi:antitoxin (DNA-binding transcriptional repressor) of toxin-antitoxin stability system
MNIFSVGEMQAQASEIIRCAQQGKLSVITLDGAPVFVAIPFDEALVRLGVTEALAVHLFDEDHISLGKAAELAGLSRVEFGRHLAQLKIPVIRGDAIELGSDLAAFDR